MTINEKNTSTDEDSSERKTDTTTTTTTTADSVIIGNEQEADCSTVEVDDENSTATTTTSSSPEVSCCRQDSYYDNNNDDNNSSNNNLKPKLPVDREWIQKLLRKYHPNSPQKNNNMKAYVLAPMVEQSDLPFRLLCRKYGTNLCYTPMIHSKLYTTSENYRKKFHPILVDTDRPLIGQLCGNNIEYLLYTANAIKPYVDAIDINCGCPQNIAKRGMYGAYLLEEEELLLHIIKHLLVHLDIPLTVKVRMLPADINGDSTIIIDETSPLKQQQRDISLEKSIQLFEKLVDAGIHL